MAAEKTHKKELKNLKEQHQSSLDDMKRKQTELKHEIQELKCLIKDFSQTGKDLAKEVSNLLEAKCKIELGLADQQIKANDKAALAEISNEELSKVKARLPFADRLLVFSSRPYTHKSSRSIPEH